MNTAGHLRVVDAAYLHKTALLRDAHLTGFQAAVTSRASEPNLLINIQAR